MFLKNIHDGWMDGSMVVSFDHFIFLSLTLTFVSKPASILFGLFANRVTNDATPSLTWGRLIRSKCSGDSSGFRWT